MASPIVSVILDRVIDQEHLIEKALAAAQPTSAKLAAGARKIFTGKGSIDAKKALFRKAFAHVVMAELARNVPAALSLADKSLAAEKKAMAGVTAADIRAIPAVKKADVMARKAERAGLEVKHGG